MNQTTSLPTTFPVAERFHSLQGEGTFTGTPMHFIRLVGCNVGMHPDSSAVQYEIGKDRDFPVLKTGRVAYRCHTYDGRGFWCDTDFQQGEKVTFDDLLNDTWEGHICLTGGEPLLHHNIDEFISCAYARRKRVHIETSGTIYHEFLGGPKVWITCSPKEHYLDEMLLQVNEIKLLVDEGFNINNIPERVHDHKCVYVQPVNDEQSVNLVNLQLCMDILKLKPHWKLSVQLHKLFGWR